MSYPPPNAWQTSGATDGPSTAWKVGHSLWLVFPIVGCGCLGGVAFMVLGMRARRLDWWIPGLVYLLLSIAGLIFVDDPEETTVVGTVTILGLLGAWFAGMLHACLINGQWLRFLATQTRWGPAPQPVGPPVGPQPGYAQQPQPGWSAPGLPQPPTATYQQPSYQNPAYPVSAYPYPTGQTSAQAFSVVVDVNTATAEQLSALPGFDFPEAVRLVAERESRGGFAGIGEFLSVAGLDGAQSTALLPLITCSTYRR